ncbi:hypothetical protein NTE_02396 [Candidatus Nitrososphaera evergladensis SR1]|uniref:Uncharacterized protein n=1 Tax=Candidatus Nitrososphaera evergladensis SR1 TaxID=1459636 RepID=A0A075MTK5_9ARCH|nr:hypothetical protein [Candidatus Nitrososphaera evergladensis]AIF84448.1 hypothetical protein NTE_02396 [Candidatus Nitrososphaera evergladensis SR1]
MVQKNLQKAVIAGGTAALAVAIVAFALVFFAQGAKPSVPASEEVDDNNDNYNNGSASDNTSTTTTTVVGKTASATSLECHNDSQAGTTTIVISAKLADKSSGHGVPGKQVIFTILPGNPVAVLSTDSLGQASVSLNASEFSEERSAVFIFFDGDEEYEFSSCRLDIVTPHASPGEPAAGANS